MDHAPVLTVRFGRPTASGTIWCCLAVVTWLGLLTGCGAGGGGPSSSDYAVRSLEVVPYMTIDGYAHAFGLLGGIVSAENGTVFVSDIQANEVLSFAADGTARGTIGGQGSGPGEFRGLRGTLAWANGELHAFDWRTQIVTRFSGDGTVLGTISWPKGRYAGSLLLVGGDRLYGREVVYPPLGPASEPPVPLQRQFAIFEASGQPTSIAALVDTIPRTEVNCASPDGEIIHPLQLPFANWFPMEAFLPSGLLAIARRDSLVVDIVDPGSGQVVRRISHDRPMVSLSDERWASLPEVAEVRRLQEEAGGELRRAADPDQPCLDVKPALLPSIRSIVSDPTGKLWVEIPSPGGFAIIVFDQNGEILGEAKIPGRDAKVPFFVSGNRLYMVTVDSLDVQSVEVYEVRGLG